MKCGNAIALLCPLPGLEGGKRVCEVGENHLQRCGNMEHPCPTGERQPPGINPSSQNL